MIISLACPFFLDFTEQLLEYGMKEKQKNLNFFSFKLNWEVLNSFPDLKRRACLFARDFK